MANFLLIQQQLQSPKHRHNAVTSATKTTEPNVIRMIATNALRMHWL